MSGCTISVPKILSVAALDDLMSDINVSPTPYELYSIVTLQTTGFSQLPSSMENSFVQVKTYQGYVLVSQELLSPCSQGTGHLHQHNSRLDVAPPDTQLGNFSQHPFAFLDTTSAYSHSLGAYSAPILEHGPSCSRMLVSGSNTHSVEDGKTTAEHYLVEGLPTEALSFGTSGACDSLYTVSMCSTNQYTDRLGFEPIANDTESGKPSTEVLGDECVLPDTWVEEKSAYSDRDENAPIKPEISNLQPASSTDYLDVRKKDKTLVIERNGFVYTARGRRVSKSGNRTSALHIHCGGTDADTKNVTDKRNNKEAAAKHTAGYISRRQTTYTNGHSLNKDKKGQKRMGRIRGHLVNFEYQERAHAKRQLDAVKDSFHGT